MIGRNKEDLNDQIKKFRPGDYILVDDDSISGNTIRFVKQLLPESIHIKDVFLMSSCLVEKPVDVVDCRDFLIGAMNSGLMVTLSGKTIRVPYIKPYVSLKTRASIPVENEIDFTRRILELNKQFYRTIGEVRLCDVNKSCQDLMKYIGFKEEDLMETIFDWHITKLE